MTRKFLTSLLRLGGGWFANHARSERRRAVAVAIGAPRGRRR